MLAQPATTLTFRRLLLTGAAGGLGRELRGRLKRYCEVLRLSDISPLGEAAAGEECIQLDLSDKAGVRQLLEGVDDAWTWRAAELLFRRQRITVQDGRVLAGDSDTLDSLQDTGGLGEMGRLLKQAGAALQPVEVKVLHNDNAAQYFVQREGLGRYAFLLDMTHEIQNRLPHGLVLSMVNARSGLKALSRVLALWVRHFLGVAVQIEPVQKVDDPAWRWHVGLDATATALLNDLYRGRIARMPAEFNFQVNLSHGRCFAPLHTLQGKVLHFSGKVKPLSGKFSPADVCFWRYTQHIPDIARFVGQPMAYLQKIHTGHSHARVVPSVAKPQ